MQNYKYIFALFFLALLAAAPSQAQCPAYLSAQNVGSLQSAALTELSGLVASRTQPGIYWAHNDSGDTPRIFAMTGTGQNLGVYNLIGATANDWEDIAIGPGPVPGQDYLYIADTGDNLAVRADVRIYRVAEPFAVNTQPGTTVVNVPGVEELIMTYPLSQKIDCETLLSDPRTGDLFLVTKELNATRIFRYPPPQSPGVPVVLEQVASILGATYTTGGDISYDGSKIALRGYFLASLRERAQGMTVAEAFATSPCSIPLANESQGESLAFAPDACAYTTIGEGLNAPVNFYAADFPCQYVFPDADGDGLSDSVEASLCTSGESYDSDLDGINDYDEVTNFGVTAIAAYNPGITHTDACMRDTDNDGVDDLSELNFGYDPLDENDTPALPVTFPAILLLSILIVACFGILMKTKLHN